MIALTVRQDCQIPPTFSKFIVPSLETQPGNLESLGLKKKKKKKGEKRSEKYCQTLSG